MNIFRYSILAIRKAGPLRFAIIAAAKINRMLTGERTLSSIQMSSVPSLARAGFTGILPLEPSTPGRFKKEFPDGLSRLLSHAQRIRAHEFEVFGKTLKFEGPILWHTDPLTKREWRKKGYSEISIHYDGSPVDPKPVWELSRHQHFVTLAQASYLSGDRSFFDELTAEWLHWIDENPCGASINWASPLELGVRLISWTLAFQFAEPLFSPKQRDVIARSVWQHCAYLAAHLSTDKVVRTNHLIGECAGLLIASHAFKFPESERWGQRGRNILEKEIHSQVHADGGVKEQSSAYHRFDVDFFLLALIATRNTQHSFSDAFTLSLQKMIEWLGIVRTPAGTLPPFGDSDNGRGFRLAPSLNFWNADGLVAAGAAFFPNDISCDLPRRNEETFWLLAEKEWNSLSVPKKASERKACIFLKESGHVVLRNGRPDEENYCFFRAGKFGMGGDGFSYHSHNDLFSPLIYIEGVPILADTGTSVYLGNDADRDYLRSAAAHNTTYASSWNLFEANEIMGWSKTADGKFRDASGADKITIECSYGNRRIPYKRTISWIGAVSSFQIEDQFAEATEGVHSYFHLEEGITARPADHSVDLLKNGVPVAHLTFAGSLSLQIERGWLSKTFGAKVDAQLLHFSWNAPDHSHVEFVLSPAHSNSKR